MPSCKPGVSASGDHPVLGSLRGQMKHLTQDKQDINIVLGADTSTTLYHHTFPGVCYRCGGPI